MPNSVTNSSSSPSIWTRCQGLFTKAYDFIIGTFQQQPLVSISTTAIGIGAITLIFFKWDWSTHYQKQQQNVSKNNNNSSGTGSMAGNNNHMVNSNNHTINNHHVNNHIDMTMASFTSWKIMAQQKLNKWEQKLLEMNIEEQSIHAPAFSPSDKFLAEKQSLQQNVTLLKNLLQTATEQDYKQYIDLVKQM